ncbi:MFS transporter [Rhodoplanes roseus]|uniref:MFS transporter n=1 Tax=Rhodoplanes roseus TaxID=29409 RepID=A0A327L3X3_9BRAD|nr:MFS transporter [Rhodoplanes roseus]RAI45770.1 MFS transporter [Rhodoplanes roseus]
MTAPTSAAPARSVGWRTPLVIVLCGSGIALLAFGPRSALGFFLTPMSQANGWGRDVFGLALAIQNLLWGLGQPFAGALADRFGTVRVMTIGTLLYAGGLWLMAYSTTPGALDLTAGVMMGFGLAGASFNLVIASFGKLLPIEWRSVSFGAGTAAGSFGQFLFSPLAVGLNQAFGWQTTLAIFAVTMLTIIPLSLAMAAPKAAPTAPGPTAAAVDAAPQQSLRQAIAEALGHRSYVLLVLGFFTCGFQLAFITVHMPAYLIDRGLSASVGGWTLAVIGLFNIAGSLASGWLGNRYPKRFLLVGNYFSRAAATAVFILLPASPAATLIYGAVMGLLWLSTVPPTSGLVLLMFGTRWFATLSGFAFFSHQVGGFLGVWIGGIAFERTGSYDLVWWLSVLFGLLSALINLPIVEKPVARLAAARA